MSTVYKVWDRERNVWLAMKVLYTDLTEVPDARKRLNREATALKKLSHPNIVQFYGLHFTEDYAFILERFIDRLTLQEILRNQHGQTMPAGESLAYLHAVASALSYVHKKGVVHCDVKPGNIMVDQGGTDLPDRFWHRSPCRQLVNVYQ